MCIYTSVVKNEKKYKELIYSSIKAFTEVNDKAILEYADGENNIGASEVGIYQKGNEVAGYMNYIRKRKPEDIDTTSENFDTDDAAWCLSLTEEAYKYHLYKLHNKQELSCKFLNHVVNAAYEKILELMTQI